MALVLPVFFLALARPIEVLEEWEVVSEAPLTESVTARGVYRRADGPAAVLPDAVQGGDPPEVFAPGVQPALAVRRGAQGWEVDLPGGSTDTVRVVARTSRTLGGVRLFRLDWPPQARSESGTPPTRRVAMVYRDWIARVPAPWTCPDDFTEVATCVSTTASVPPLSLRIPPPRVSRAALLAAIGALLAAFVAAARLGRGDRARARLAGAIGGAFVGACVALAVVGARATGWVPALLEAAVPGALAGTLAARGEGARFFGALALLVVPLLVVFDGRLSHVLAVSLASLVAMAALAARFREPAVREPPESAESVVAASASEEAAPAATVSSDSPSESSPPPPPASGP